MLVGMSAYFPAGFSAEFIVCIHIRKTFNVRQYGAKKETGKCIEDGGMCFQMCVLLLFRFSEADRQVGDAAVNG